MEWEGVVFGFEPYQFGEDIHDALDQVLIHHVHEMHFIEDELSLQLSYPLSVLVKTSVTWTLYELQDTLERMSYTVPSVLRLVVQESPQLIDALGKKAHWIEEETMTPEATELSPYASTSHEGWAPAYGTSNVSQTRAYNTFVFNCSCFTNPANTYEHETQIYNNAFASYAGYWTSNMPDPYWDTAFLDTIFHPTVGSFSATKFGTKTYFTDVSLRKGSVSTAPVKIKGQLGHRSPASCYSTWCVYPEATTQAMANFNAPAGLTWIY